jgi:hypothetical protein
MDTIVAGSKHITPLPRLLQTQAYPTGLIKKLVTFSLLVINRQQPLPGLTKETGGSAGSSGLPPIGVSWVGFLLFSPTPV